jgi:predicted transcriptional regulator
VTVHTLMSKKRYTLYLSHSLARRLDDTAKSSHGGKSALVEEALAASLTPQHVPGIDSLLAGRLDNISGVVKTIERDVAIVTETLALFVRYFLTVTPPLPSDEQEPARLLGRERFQVFVAQVGRQLAGDQRLVSEVLQTIVDTNPDLFGIAGDDTPLKKRPATKTANAVRQTNGHDDDDEAGHG